MDARGFCLRSYISFRANSGMLKSKKPSAVVGYGRSYGAACQLVVLAIVNLA